MRRGQGSVSQLYEIAQKLAKTPSGLPRTTAAATDHNRVEIRSRGSSRVRYEASARAQESIINVFALHRRLSPPGGESEGCRCAFKQYSTSTPDVKKQGRRRASAHTRRPHGAIVVFHDNPFTRALFRRNSLGEAASRSVTTTLFSSGWHSQGRRRFSRKIRGATRDQRNMQATGDDGLRDGSEKGSRGAAARNQKPQVVLVKKHKRWGKWSARQTNSNLALDFADKGKRRLGGCPALSQTAGKRGRAITSEGRRRDLRERYSSCTISSGRGVFLVEQNVCG